ncbi:hypothetical protein, partial [Meiothermus taiwanensis]|uniref:hypothetical protein n=1 Tax=Meiothermus taiwanensis TaxID=172827 RepID=UPI001FD9A15A
MPFAGPLDGLPEPRHQILGLGLGALDAGDAQPHPVPALGGLERGPGMNQGLHKVLHPYLEVLLPGQPAPPPVPEGQGPDPA